jgi:hypothetical protein
MKLSNVFALSLAFAGLALIGCERLLVISFFNPSAPFPPKARGRWGFDC